MEAHHTGNQWTYLEVKRSKVKVTRPINDHTVNVQYLPNGKAYNVKFGTQTQHEDPHQRKRRDLQGQWSRSVARSRYASDKCSPISREWNVIETPKLVEGLPTSRAITRTSFKIIGRRSRSPGWLMLRLEVCHIFRTERPTNFKLGTQTEYEDSYRRQAPRPPTSKVKIAMSRRGAYDRC